MVSSDLAEDDVLAVEPLGLGGAFSSFSFSSPSLSLIIITIILTQHFNQTWPKTTCLPSSHWVLAVQRKNWDPLVLGPALAMERTPGPVCLRVKFSSSNLLP